MSTEEQKAIVDGFKSPDAIQASGFKLAGTKYFTIQVGDRTVQGKKAVRSGWPYGYLLMNHTFILG